MTKTVRNWVEFIGEMGENHKFALQPKGARYEINIDNYIPAERALKEFDGWLDDIVTKAYIDDRNNEDGCHYHLLQYECEE